MNNALFIITTNENSANELLKTGLPLVSSSPGRWVFMNTYKKNFDYLNCITYSNILTF